MDTQFFYKSIIVLIHNDVSNSIFRMMFCDPPLVPIIRGNVETQLSNPYVILQLICRPFVDLFLLLLSAPLACLSL